MIVSISVSFAACSLLWTAEIVNLESLAGPIDLDHPTPKTLGLNILAVLDGQRRAVHPAIFSALLQGENTRELVRAAALAEIRAVARRLLEGPAGDVQATPELVDNPREAVARWVPLNAPYPGA